MPVDLESGSLVRSHLCSNVKSNAVQQATAAPPRGRLRRVGIVQLTAGGRSDRRAAQYKCTGPDRRLQIFSANAQFTFRDSPSPPCPSQLDGATTAAQWT
jgi:hypothetical protein